MPSTSSSSPPLASSIAGRVLYSQCSTLAATPLFSTPLSNLLWRLSLSTEEHTPLAEEDESVLAWAKSQNKGGGGGGGKLSLLAPKPNVTWWHSPMVGERHRVRTQRETGQPWWAHSLKQESLQIRNNAISIPITIYYQGYTITLDNIDMIIVQLIPNVQGACTQEPTNDTSRPNSPTIHPTTYHHSPP